MQRNLLGAARAAFPALRSREGLEPSNAADRWCALSIYRDEFWRIVAAEAESNSRRVPDFVPSRRARPGFISVPGKVDTAGADRVNSVFDDFPPLVDHGERCPCAKCAEIIAWDWMPL